MVDIHTIINDHKSKKTSRGRADVHREFSGPIVDTIPELFFDQILILFKLSRIETLVLAYLYRKVWCRHNPHREFGISQLLSHTEMAKSLDLSMDEVHPALRKLEEYGLISTIRSGQYFIRKYFTQENDEKFGQNYDDFEM